MKDSVQRVGRWGNSLAVRVPKVVADEAGLAEGTAVEIRVHGGKLTVARKAPHYALADLLAKVTPKNRHDASWTGGPVGDEVW